MTKWNDINGISIEANKLFRKYGHFYNMPSAGRDFSSTASALAIGGVVIALIGLLKRFWWNIPIGILIYILMAYVSKLFNPTCFITSQENKSAHEEIISYITKKQEEK